MTFEQWLDSDLNSKSFRDTIEALRIADEALDNIDPNCRCEKLCLCAYKSKARANEARIQIRKVLGVT